MKIVKKLEEDTLNQKEVRMEYVKRDIWLKVAGENQWAKINSLG